MSKKCASKKSKAGDKLRGAKNAWEKAILDAEKRVLVGESRIRELKRAITTFKEMRDSGEPWPGTSALGQKGKNVAEPGERQ